MPRSWERSLERDAVFDGLLLVAQQAALPLLNSPRCSNSLVGALFRARSRWDHEDSSQMAATARAAITSA